jgi:hypothetical protein
MMLIRNKQKTKSASRWFYYTDILCCTVNEHLGYSSFGVLSYWMFMNSDEHLNHAQESIIKWLHVTFWNIPAPWM